MHRTAEKVFKPLGLGYYMGAVVDQRMILQPDVGIVANKVSDMVYRTQCFRNDIQSIEDALRLTLIHGFPRGSVTD